jgi:hypothetical protein
MQNQLQLINKENHYFRGNGIKLELLVRTRGKF